MRNGHKYGAVSTMVEGIRFASKAEARRYSELCLLEKAGEIHGIVLQPGFELAVFNRGGGLPTSIGKYVADFAYCRCLRTPCVRSHLVYEDVKGFKTPLYRWKKKHVEAQYGISITEIRMRRVRGR